MPDELSCPVGSLMSSFLQILPSENAIWWCRFVPNGKDFLYGPLKMLGMGDIPLKATRFLSVNLDEISCNRWSRNEIATFSL